MQNGSDRHRLRAWALVLALATTSAVLLGLDALTHPERGVELALAWVGAGSI